MVTFQWYSKINNLINISSMKKYIFTIDTFIVIVHNLQFKTILFRYWFIRNCHTFQYDFRTVEIKNMLFIIVQMNNI